MNTRFIANTSFSKITRGSSQDSLAHRGAAQGFSAWPPAGHGTAAAGQPTSQNQPRGALGSGGRTTGNPQAKFRLV